VTRKKVVRSSDGRRSKDIVVNIPGNHFAKHASTNRIVKLLMTRFHDTLIDMLKTTGASSMLDIGCGEGYTTGLVASSCELDIVASDLEPAAFRSGAGRELPFPLVAASAYQLPFPTVSFDLVMGTEILEHLDDPVSAVVEARRVARRWVLFTVPWEPWWRLANLARGAYLTSLGNTPGHVQHWTTRGFRDFLDPHFSGVEVRRAAMWSFALCEK
jgi:SAM-dependent methyltransferase